MSEQQLGLIAQIREDYATHGRDWTRPGFRSLVVHRFGVWRMGIRLRLLRAPLSMIYRSLYRYVRNHYGIEMYYTVTIGRRLHIAHQGCITIHPFATIGDDCIIRQGVTLGAAAEYSETDAPVLGNQVNVGAGAMILGRVRVGDRARIGPNAVVMSNVPAGATATAAPARIIQLSRPDPSPPPSQTVASDQTPVAAGR